MKEFFRKLLSTNEASSMRFSLLIGIFLIVVITICVLVIAFKYTIWGLSLDAISQLRDFALVIIGPLIGGKIFQKFAEVKENKEEKITK